ncbi:hypothetical protein WMY93_030015 [Mugilogobius chulae]|uniref:Ig-like domain-containing protein n=1 Tax=Mugilogobius chulae TaxID=88201 RepID=A0AAW0MSU9_9GOBI
MEFIGDLPKKDCTTMFYDLNQNNNGDYKLRIENPGGFTASADCDPLHITVRDAPWIPSITVSGEQTETEVVTITCSAVTPCPLAPPKLTWDLYQDTANITERNSDGTFTTKIRQNITLTDGHDGKIIKCSAAYPVTGAVRTTESNITLNVTYGPKNTSAVVSPSGSLSAGQSVTLSCSSRAKPPVQHFTWFRHSSQGPVNVSEGQNYTFNFTEDGEYYCEALNTLGNKTSPTISLKSITGKGKYLSPKDTQVTMSLSKATEEETIHDGEIEFSNLSPKEVPKTEQEETVYSQVQVHKPCKLCHWQLVKRFRKCIWTNKVFNQWRPEQILSHEVHWNLKIKDCTTMFYDLNQNHQDDYYLRIENSGFTASAACDSLHITVRVAPWIPSITVSGDQTETKVVTITCSAVTPCPDNPPNITWDLQQGTANIKDKNSDGTFTTKITHSITLTDAHDGLMIKCNASYPVSGGGFKMAANSTTLSVSYAPKNTSAVVSPSGSLSAVRDLSPTRRRRDATLSSTGVNSNTWRLRGYEQAHTRSPPHTMGNPREMERPAPLKGNGSRAQVVRGAPETVRMARVVWGPLPDHRPKHTAPFPYGPSCGWWACKKVALHCLSGWAQPGPVGKDPATRRSPTSSHSRPGSRLEPR